MNKQMDTTESRQDYGFGTSLQMPMEQAMERVAAALKQEGFGILTTIDVKETMKQKLDVDFEPYYILGACNPPLAYRALTTEHDVGLLLPCNVIVHSHGDQTRVDIADPITMMSAVDNPGLEDVAREARERLQRVVQHLQAGQ